MSLLHLIPNKVGPKCLAGGFRVIRTRHLSGFSFAGPRKLDEIMKIDLIEGKSKAEVSDLWMTYHENKEHVHGCFLSGDEGRTILSRAHKM
jgi:hypothetical protein